MSVDAEAVRVPQFDLPDRLRKSREVVGLTQAELADEIGVSRTTVRNYEADRVQPRPGALKLWALRTGVPLEWLLTGEVTTNPQPDGPTGGEGLLRLDSNQRPSDYQQAQINVVPLRAARSTGEPMRRAA